MYTSDYYDYGTAAGAAAGGIIGGLLVFLVVMCIICIAVAVLKIIGTWKILRKADQPGWGALIPFYNQYLLCKITGVNPWWILIVVLSPFLSIIPVIGSLVSMAASIYFLILLNVSLARSFGKEDGFAVGLILLAPIFYFILGIKEDKYQGANPMNDVIFKKVASSVGTQTASNDFTSGKDENVKYCSSCGAKVEADTKFCPSCGSEMK